MNYPNTLPVFQGRFESGVYVSVVELSVQDHEDTTFILLIDNLLDLLRGWPQLVFVVKL